MARNDPGARSGLTLGGAVPLSSITEDAQAYIAGDRRRALAAGVPLADRVCGAAIFADISGFTPLTEALAAELGPQRGAEELTVVLNLVYDAVLGELHRYSGSVIYFSGDAVTCWLDGDDGSLAVFCALAMQKAMERVKTVRTPGGATVGLAMKVAVAAGHARRFVVGDPDIQLIDVLAGELMDRLANAEHHAERGEVVVDSVTLETLSGALELALARGHGQHGVGVVGALSGPAPVLKPPMPYPKLSRAVVKQWLLPAVYQRMRSGRGEFLSELRPAVPVFVRFGGIDFDNDVEAHLLLDHFIRRAQRVIDSYGGNVLQLTIGDKGAYLFAVFGCPLAHEDDAARACAAALEVLDLELGTAATGLQVGVSSGRVRSGAYGHSHRRAFTCLGDAVNIAARLMQAAPPGQVYLTTGVARDAGGSFNFEDLPPLTVKGKSATVSARRLVGRSGRAIQRLERPVRPMVGRSAELGQLVELGERARAGNGQVLGLVAEAGMGKSRLTEEGVRLLSARGMRAFAGAAASVGSATSYLAWQSVWAMLFGIEPEGDPVPQLEKALSQVDPSLLPRLPLLGAVLGVPVEDNELTRNFDAKLRKSSLESLLSRYLTLRAKCEPLVLVLEDCHWLDPLSSDLLDVLARVVPSLPVLVLLNYRPGPFKAPALRHTTVLELDRLDPGSCRELVVARLTELYGPETKPSEPMLEKLLSRAEGNPFYLEELVNYLYGQGVNLADAAGAASLELPGSLASLVLSRIDALAEPPRRVLKVASVVGREFGFESLNAAHPRLGARRAVIGHLSRLCARDLLMREEPASDNYAFKHAVIHEVAYESLPFAMRARLHGRIGAWLELTSPEALDLLAHHFWHSADETKKRVYLRRAGEAAEARYANDTAIDYYRRLAGLLPDEDRGEVLRKLGVVLELRGDWAGSEAAYTEALRLAEALDDGGAAAWSLVGRSVATRRLGRYDDAAADLDAAARNFQAIGDTPGMARVAHVRGVVSYQRGELDEAWEQLQLSLVLWKEIGNREAEARVLDSLAVAAIYRENYEVAADLGQQVLDLWSALGHRWGVAISHLNLGVHALLREEYALATSHEETALAILLETGDTYNVAQVRHNLGDIARDTGDRATAGEHYAAALEMFRDLGDRRGLCMVYEAIALLLAGSAPLDALRLVGAA
ncbi:MAG TPA: AAA family ATPase, partial [Acidimicrobiales bacterium]|nr:AAA family ATPase [Acidimicrobiales bacterium]